MTIAVRQLYQLLWCGLLGLALALGLPTLATESIAPNSDILQSARPYPLLEQGIDRYGGGQFFEAATAWQQSASAFANAGDGLGEALALSNLSLAYQQLGRWEDARNAIETSLNRLQGVDATEGDRAEVLAKALNTHGRWYWMRGDLEAARSRWQSAARYYVEAGDPNGAAIAQINQSKAMQALGLSRQAADLLQQIEQRFQERPDSDLKAVGLRNLGSALRQVGDLASSRDILTQSLQLAEEPQTLNLGRLELGNTERALASRAMALGKTDAAQTHIAAALELYQQANGQLQAQLNRLSLLVEMGEISEASQLWSTLGTEIAQLPPSRSSVEAQLNFAQSLTCLHPELSSRASLVCDRAVESNADAPKIDDISQVAIAAVHRARELRDARIEAYAVGQLGWLYELIGQPEEAKILTQQALLKADEIQAEDIRYRWEWQLGRIATQQGKPQEAIAAYQTATTTLQSVRRDLLSVDPEVQFSFRDRVEPLYREFVSLLLQGENGLPPSEENLQQAIRSVDALQLAELEDFLSCRLQALGELEQIEDPNAAIIYPILLDDRLALILQRPGQPLDYRETPVSSGEAIATFRALRRNLTVAANTPEVLESGQKAYTWLVTPLEPLLQQDAQIETLVFVLDGVLRNIPMAVLHDGEEYLIEKGYGVAVAPRLQLFRPQPSRGELLVNTGGIGIPQTIDEIVFPPIDRIAEEIDRVAERVNIGEPLLDEAFTTANIQQQLTRDRFSAIHWKTHGVFSSDPEETYIVAYNERIQARDLNALIQTRDGGNQPLELLVLSACETAKGDDRAVLGLAGIAARTGARSVVSTLWTARDAPNTELMARFYAELANGATKARALQRAQLALMREYGYTTPHIWGTYVLVGNWL